MKNRNSADAFELPCPACILGRPLLPREELRPEGPKPQQLAGARVLAERGHGNAAQGERRRVVAQPDALEGAERVADDERARGGGDQGVHRNRLLQRLCVAGVRVLPTLRFSAALPALTTLSVYINSGRAIRPPALGEAAEKMVDIQVEEIGWTGYS